jgi:integrase
MSREKLNETRIRNSKKGTKPIKLTDGSGLYLEVRPSGAKLWRYRYRIDGKENVFAAGRYAKAVDGETEPQAEARRNAGDLTLSEARMMRHQWRGLVKQGIHPVYNREALKTAQISENANSFEAITLEWIAQNRSELTPDYLGQVESIMRADVFPHVGRLPIRAVTAAHLLEIVKRVEERAPRVAFLIRQWCSAVFRYAVSTLRADGDPAVALKGCLKKRKVKHRKPLTRAQIPTLLRALKSSSSFRATTIAIELLMLTFVRPGELRAAEWSEFDLNRAEWRIPEERMKMRKPHIVPLCTQAIELLQELYAITGASRWLFPNYRRPVTYMSMSTMNRALESMGYGGKFSAHGFRATASTMLNEMGYKSDVIERQLAHQERNSVRASYNQAEYLEERRQMMQQWANYIYSLADGEKVIPGRFGKAAA